MLLSKVRSVEQLKLLPSDSFYVTINGRIVDWKQLKGNEIFDVHFRLRGGKGGFGSLLRSFRIHRSTNQLMCRDLSGRRLADVKEEEKLRQWIEKAAEREAEKQRKRREKYEKLKSGPPKHEFNDPEYMAMREKILKETEDAVEAGLCAYLSKSQTNINDYDNFLSSDDSESDGASKPGPSGLGSKRKRPVKEFKRKQFKIDSPCVPAEPIISVAEKDKETDVEQNVQKNVDVAIVENIENNQPSVKIIEGTDSNLSGQSEKVVVYEDIDLENFESVDSLKVVGLDCLKHALKVRGLKCGGTLDERARRLFSVKGLKKEDYPKSIRALPLRKKA